MKILNRKEAIQIGLKRYFTGRPCKYGHISERYTKRCVCVECSKEYNIDYIPKRTYKHSADYYEKNKTTILENARKHRLRDPKRFMLANRRGAKKFRQTHPERVKQRIEKWRKENPDRLTVHVATRKAKKLSATPSWANLDAIKEIYKLAQALTQITGVRYSVDHIIPLQGKLVSGLHVENNLQVMPLNENCRKSNKFNPLIHQIA